MGRLAVFAWRTAVQRGLFGGNRTWMAVFGVMAAAKVVRRIAGSEPETVFRGELRPGEGLIITHLTETFD